MKKSVALLLSLLMLVSFVSCGKGGNPVDDIPEVNDIESELENPDDDIADEFDDIDITNTPDDSADAEHNQTDDLSVCTVSDDNFTLTLEGKNTYQAGEEIYFEARVTLDNATELTVYSSDPILSFGLEGDRYFNDGQGGATSNDVLVIYDFSSDEEYVYPLTKSGGWSASDPDADFYNEFFSNPEYILPEGSYKVYAIFTYSTDEEDIVGTKHTLMAACNFDVVATAEKEGLSVQVTKQYFEDGGSVTCYPDDEQAEELYAIVVNGEWIQSLGDCLSEYLIIINGNEYHYHSDCGTINDYTNMCCKTLDKELKESLNTLLEDIISSMEK